MLSSWVIGWKLSCSASARASSTTSVIVFSVSLRSPSGVAVPGVTRSRSAISSAGANPSRPRAPILVWRLFRSMSVSSKAVTKNSRPFLSLSSRFLVNVPGRSPRSRLPSSIDECSG
jgi:hypothetical protein